MNLKNGEKMNRLILFICLVGLSILSSCGEKNIEKEIIQFITPLGVNLDIKPAILFDKDPQINLKWTKCEPFGCVAVLTNNSEIKEIVKVFNDVKKGLTKSKEMQLGIQGFNTEPLVVKFLLKGFVKASSLLVGVKNEDI